MRIKFWFCLIFVFPMLLNLSCNRQGWGLNSIVIQNYLETKIDNWWQKEPDPDYSRASRFISQEGKQLLENFTWTITLPKTAAIDSWNINQFLAEFIYAKSFYSYRALKTLFTEYPGNAVPGEYQYLAATAKLYYGCLNKPVPRKWDLQALLTVFPNAGDLYDKIHEHYQEELKRRSGSKQGLFTTGKTGEHTFMLTLEAHSAAGTVASLESFLNAFGFHDIVKATGSKNKIILTISDTAADNAVNDGMGFYIVNEAAQTTLDALEIPGSRDPAVIREMLLEKKIIDENIIVLPVVENALRDSDSKVGFDTLEKENSMKILNLKAVRAQDDPITHQPVITFSLITEDAKRFAALTAENTERTLCIVIMDKVIFQAKIAERIEGGDVRISGLFNREECQALVSFMKKFTNK